MSRKVIAKIVGGIGNQLFCYAAARRFALRNDAALCLDLDFFRSDVHYGRSYRSDSFELPPHEILQSRRVLPAQLDLYAWRLKRRLAGAGVLPGCDWLIESTPGVFDARLLEARVTRTTGMDGYWQDERYFSDIEPVLRQDLTFRPEVSSRSRDIGQRIAASNAVAVHVRRLYGDGGVLDVAYYRKAIEQIIFRVERPEFFCFGDDPGWLREHWPRDLPMTLVHDPEVGGEVEDLRLMAGCRHFIVANSTFSWWGAWLGANLGKVVIAPRAKGLRYRVRPAEGWIEIDW